MTLPRSFHSSRHLPYPWLPISELAVYLWQNLLTDATAHQSHYFTKGSFEPLNEGFSFNVDLSVFSNDCHRYGRHFPFQKPCLAHQGTLLPLTLVLGKYKYHLFLPFCLSSLLLSFLWWIFTASLGAELTSAQVITGHNHSQIRHSMYGAQARDPEIHRITSRFLSNQYSQVSPVDQQWPGTLVS